MQDFHHFRAHTGREGNSEMLYPDIALGKIIVVIFYVMSACLQLRGVTDTVKDFGMINATFEATLLGVATF
jgi:hypothetical protein